MESIALAGMGPRRRHTPGKKRRPARTGAQPEDHVLALVLAADVATTAEATRRPADRLLRDALRATRLPPAAAALAAEAMFAWFRWRGFSSRAGEPVGPANLQRAMNFAARFAREPGSFDDAALFDGAFPAWWRAHWTVTPALVRALQTPPVLWLRARPGAAAQLAGALAGAHAEVALGVPDAVRYAGGDDVFHSLPFAKGRCEIQDIASQAVGIVCAPRPGEKWWDACAGEGGKTLHLCDLMQNRGLVWASDRSALRLAVLRRRARRAGLFNYRATPWAGGPRPPTRTLFDGVLVDAPCSGIGTWHRNPHARWTTGPVDVQELAAVQEKLLAVASQAVRPGGRLVYAVCTLTHEETAGVADAFGRAFPHFTPDVFADPFSSAGTPVSRIAWEPQVTGGNGMFVAAWRRAPG